MDDTKPCFSPNGDHAPSRLLLHACCGPCSLEPLRVLGERDINTTIHFSNSNIAPYREYEQRRKAIVEHAASIGIGIIEDEYDNLAWQESVGKIGAAEPGSEKRRARCRACYRMRLDRSARYASENGFDALGTTLSVSPYQYGDIIREELERACEHYGLQAFYEDYSPLYPQATARSKAAGMYRQNYCGCLFSDEEAKHEREERKAARERDKLARAEARRPEEERLETRRAEKRAYDEKRAHKRAILKSLREEAKRSSLDRTNTDGGRTDG